MAARVGAIEHCGGNAYVNVLPESDRLAEVTSNFWGTKFSIVSSNCAVLPASLGEVVYKASLLHLQPRQMRIEITDLLDSGTADNDDDDADDDEDEDLFVAQVANEYSDEDDDKFVGEEDRNVLRITAASNKKEEESIAPIAPLPSRLSFCLPPANMNAASARPPQGSNEAAICDVSNTIPHQEPASLSNAARKQSPMRKSPVKTVVGQVLARAGERPQLAKDSVTSPDKQPSPYHQSSEAAQAATAAPLSPSKLRLRMSVSCDNYLSDAKFGLSRRDSVGSSSPHSSKGSPRRWAAKVDELGPSTAAAEVGEAIVVEKEAVVGACALSASTMPGLSPSRSCSANELDVIVDLLGVPSDLLTQKDLNRRLFLLNERKREEEEQKERSRSRRRNKTVEGGTPALDKCGKSKSCEDPPPSVVMRRKSKSGGGARSKKDIELKRRSNYSKDCRGRSEAKTCETCEDIASQVNDLDLNREIFDVPPRERKAERLSRTEIDAPHGRRSDSSDDDFDRVEVVLKDQPAGGRLGPIRENIPVTQQLMQTDEDEEGKRRSRSKSRGRKFDSVRNLLEKARSILLLSNASSSSKSSRESSAEQGTSRPRSRRSLADDKNALRVETEVATSSVGTESFTHTQSSPNTPLMKRKKSRHRSFSPVK